MDYNDVSRLLDAIVEVRNTLLETRTMTVEEYEGHRKGVRAEQLAQMATTLAAGMFQRDPRGQGYHVHNEVDRMNVARVSVEMARWILVEVELQEAEAP